MYSCSNLEPEVLHSHDYEEVKQLIHRLAGYVSWNYHSSGLGHHDGEDAAITVVVHLRRFAMRSRLPQGARQFGSYIYTTLNRRARRIAKRHRRRCEISFDLLMADEANNKRLRTNLLEATTDLSCEGPGQLAVAERLDKILSLLPQKDRKFLEGWLGFLRQSPGASFRQYAQAIGMNANQAGVKMDRIRKRVRHVKNRS